MSRYGQRSEDIVVGTRYQRRDAQNIVWEVVSLFLGKDGRSHAALSNVGDPTWRKTISQVELEQGREYIRVPTK